MISRVRGTEDRIDLRLHDFVLDCIKKHFMSYNFKEIQLPILEHTNLFIHSLGSQTDVVSKEMYVFDAERNENSICLRPEGTASTIRACFENRIQHFPWKTFLYGPMFRRERPQKGRWREFYQLSIEVIGSTSISQDAHFIKMLDALVSDVFKLEEYALKLNFLGCLDDRKKHKDALIAFLNEHESEICDTCKTRKDTNTLRVFDCKNPVCSKLYQNAPKLVDHLCENCNKEWVHLRAALEMLSVNYVIEPKLVRGLDYYNKTVFEFSSSLLGAQDAFCGGGRYNLGQQVGAKQDYDAIGCAFGMGRLLLLIEQIQDKLSIPAKKPLHVILPLSDEQDNVALLLAQTLQKEGFSIDIVFEKASMTNMMKKANRLDPTYVLIIGEDEQKEGMVSVKNMQTGKTEKVIQADVVSLLK